MKRQFRVQKLEIDKLINLLIELYENGVDYVDLSCDLSDPEHDKLIVQTRDEYINPDFTEKFEQARKENDYPTIDSRIEEKDDEDPPSSLSEDNLNELI